MICPARLGRGCRGRPSKPSADSDDQARFLHGLAFGAREAGGVAELPFPRHADIRRDLALDLITEAKTQLGVANACADLVLGPVLGREVVRGARSEDQYGRASCRDRVGSYGSI